MYGDLRDVKWVDDRMQKLFDKMGRDTPTAQQLEAEYNMKLIEFGDVFWLEHAELSHKERLRMPLTTPLGVETEIALKTLVEWITTQLRLALMPMS